MSIKIFVEGGGRGRLRAECREGFKTFLEKAGFQGRMPQIIPCGPRNEAYDQFKMAYEINENCLLLVDSEGPVTEGHRPWQHLNARDGWAKPRGVAEEHCHMMVQVMESWFLADRDTLADYYGQGFQTDAIPRYQNVETVPKQDVLEKLKQATLRTKKGEYSKGSHSFRILAKINPDKVTRASQYANRFIAQLEHEQGLKQ